MVNTEMAGLHTIKTKWWDSIQTANKMAGLHTNNRQNGGTTVLGTK